MIRQPSRPQELHIGAVLGQGLRGVDRGARQKGQLAGGERGGDFTDDGDAHAGILAAGEDRVKAPVPVGKRIFEAANAFWP